MSTHKLLTPQQESRILDFGKKKYNLSLCQKVLKVFDHFRQKKPATCRSKQDQQDFWQFLLQFIGSVLLNLISHRGNCFNKKAIAHPKKSKSTIITPGVDYEKPICSFLIAKKRFDEYSDFASKTIILLWKLQTTFSKRVVCFRIRRSIFAHFLSLSSVPGLWVFCEWSWDLFIVIWQLVKRFLSKQRSLLMFLFVNEGHIVDKENFGLQVCFT